MDLASVKRLNDHLKQWIPVGRFLPHSGAALTLRPLEPHQGVPEMLGCCLQDEGQPHYTFEAKGFTREELVEGKLRYGLWHRAGGMPIAMPSRRRNPADAAFAQPRRSSGMQHVRLEEAAGGWCAAAISPLVGGGVGVRGGGRAGVRRAC